MGLWYGFVNNELFSDEIIPHIVNIPELLSKYVIYDSLEELENKYEHCKQILAMLLNNASSYTEIKQKIKDLKKEIKYLSR